jgi:hypothetical protein
VGGGGGGNGSSNSSNSSSSYSQYILLVFGLWDVIVIVHSSYSISLIIH